ncbi:hypothetical protein [Kribbella endophytica]
MFEIIVPVLVAIVILAGNRMKKQANGNRPPGTLTPRMQRMLEKMQAQQGFQPPTPQGQYTQPASGHGSPGHAGTTVQSSAQMAGQHNTQYHGPAPYAGAPTQAMPFAQPGQFQPPQIQQTPFQQGQFQAPAIWNPPAPQGRAAHPKQSQRDLDSRVREMMKAGNEVGAVRLLCDEQDLGIIDAQKRARSLVAPAAGNGGNGGNGGGSPERDREGASRSPADTPEQETRYVGSAAFADSLFDTNRDDQETWASGWTEVPEVEDRSDMDELWKTVRDHGRPGPG